MEEVSTHGTLTGSPSTPWSPLESTVISRMLPMSSSEAFSQKWVPSKVKNELQVIGASIGATRFSMFATIYSLSIIYGAYSVVAPASNFPSRAVQRRPFFIVGRGTTGLQFQAVGVVRYSFDLRVCSSSSQVSVRLFRKFPCMTIAFPTPFLWMVSLT